MNLINKLSLIALVFLLIMITLFYTGSRINLRYTSQIQAIMKLKLELSNAHLWFEEIISGDKTEDIETVWTAMTESLKYSNALLEGGEIHELKIFPLTDEPLRETMQEVGLKLEKFRQMTEMRYRNQQNSLPGSPIEQTFDQLFADILKKTDRLEHLILLRLKDDLAGFQHWGIILLLISAILSVLIIRSFLSHEKRHAQQIQKLSQTQLEIQRKNAQLEDMVLHDTLTGLPNRLYFSTELQQSIACANRENQSLILMFIDLDRFKSINDNYGHTTGDELLKQLARRLFSAVRAEDIVARLSGDEFVVLLKHHGDQRTTIDNANHIALKMIEALTPAYEINDSAIFITASIGISLFPQDGEDTETLLKNADRAMYKVKNLGKNNFNFFSRDLYEEASKRLHLEQDLHLAITQQQLELYYQPQYQLDNNALYCLEALVRWVHPEYGMIMPSIFIPIAESCGLIKQIDTWVLQTACKQMQAWQKQGIAPGRLSINLSAVLFAQPDLNEQVMRLLVINQIDADSIELEITENVLMNDSGQTVMSLNSLRENKLRIAIDDFGTGYSSLAYLSNYSFTTLKIDQGFVSKLTTNKSVGIIVKTIIQMALELDYKIIAEGVETQEQKQFLLNNKCHYAQGFLFSKPLSKISIDGLLRKHQQHEALYVM